MQQLLGLLIPLPPLYASVSIIAAAVEKVRSVVQISVHSLCTSRNILSSEHMVGISLKHVLSKKAAAKQPLRFFSPRDSHKSQPQELS